MNTAPTKSIKRSVMMMMIIIERRNKKKGILITIIVIVIVIPSEGSVLARERGKGERINKENERKIGRRI